jgi:hypothetical protein
MNIGQIMKALASSRSCIVVTALLLTFKANAQFSADTIEIFPVTTGAYCPHPKLIPMGKDVACFWARLGSDSSFTIHAQLLSNSGELSWEKRGVPIGHLFDVPIPLYSPNPAYDAISLNDSIAFIAGVRELLFEETRDLVLQGIYRNSKLTWPEMWIADSNLSVDYSTYPGKAFKLLTRDETTGWLLWGYRGHLYLRSFDVNSGPGLVDTSNGLGWFQFSDAASTGDGGFYAATWLAVPAEGSVYVHKYDKNGTAVWPKPVLVKSENKPATSLNQIRTLTLPDTSVMVLWTVVDDNTNNYRINAQRVRKNGEMVFDSSGIVLVRDVELPRRIDARMMPDSSIRLMYHTYPGLIGAQKFTASGNVSWGSTGVIVGDTVGPNRDARCATGEDGTFHIVWMHGNDIMYQQLDSTGTPKWPSLGKQICVGEQYKDDPDICVIGTTALIAWRDDRKDSIGIFAAIISSEQGTLAVEASDEEYAIHQGDRATSAAKFIDVYPNPANEYVVVKVKEGLLHGTVRIHDCLGGLVKEFHLDGGNHNAVWTLDDSCGKRVNPGIYVACVIGAQQVYRTTFVVF